MNESLERKKKPWPAGLGAAPGGGGVGGGGDAANVVFWERRTAMLEDELGALERRTKFIAAEIVHARAALKAAGAPGLRRDRAAATVGAGGVSCGSGGGDDVAGAPADACLTA